MPVLFVLSVLMGLTLFFMDARSLAVGIGELHMIINIL